jgi:2-succinyl-5-enolpyruvyl-6-hydroxy-3-cyclohexene-1-carboxylate synthase
MTPLDFRNTNSLWCGVLVETLVRSGVTQAVISPGSRSTPLTMAFARHPRIEAIPVLDERSAGFFALGLAKQQGRPTVLVCTSGTAGANYFPAVIEAQESGVPLLVITADRPPEMRDCSSGQTIDQQKLFGAHVNWQHEFAVPEPRLELLRYLRQTLLQAFDRALGPSAGPVHLNAPFRDPLAPIEDKTAAGLKDHDWEAFFATTVAPPSKGSPASLIPVAARGLIIAGPAQPGDPRRWSEAVWTLAKHHGWPVLADALNPLRTHASTEATLVTAYDAILRSPALAKKLKPEFIVCVENWPTSKVLRTWIEELNVPAMLLTASAQNRDPLHGRTWHFRHGIEEVSLSSSQTFPDRGAEAYETAWRQAETAARGRIDEALAGAPEFEGGVVWKLSRHLPAETPLFIANSMPVRDAEYFWPASDRRLRIYVNRGANGIDGTLSTALGVAHGNRPAVLLTGDLSLLHDTNGFLHRPWLRGSLTVVLINNNGGGIFDHLAVAQFDPPFEKFWATPQPVDFAKLCAAYGVTHVAVRDEAHLLELTTTLPESGLRVLEVRTDRKHDAAFRKKLFAEVAAALK